MGRVRLSLLAGVAAGCLSFAGAAAANPIFLPTLTAQIQKDPAIQAANQKLTPPTPPCPESGMLPAPFSNCGLPETPATTLPYMGNMAYWGGHVQTVPKVYIVYWGWGESGAFGSTPCGSGSTFTEPGLPASVTLKCDPNGAGKYMADFVSQMGGTGWAGVSTQYYQLDAQNNPQYITNPSNVLGGIWADDTNSITGLPSTTGSAPAGSGNTYYDLAAEAQRAIAHFGLTQADLANANIVIAQPPAYSDPNALSTGYCAFHDYTDTRVPSAAALYKGPDITDTFAYTNMPYSLAINSSGVNVCGKDAVNPTPQGDLDGFSIVLGHEIEETITDPGAEDVINNGGLNQTYDGGWYDTVDANENGDKCAWVGENPLTFQGTIKPIYGEMGNIQGNAGTTFAVQALWSNAANAGTGYCAGAGTDSPLPSSTYGSTTPASSGGSTSSSSGSPSTTSSTWGSGSSTPATTAGTTKTSTAKTALTHKQAKKGARKLRKNGKKGKKGKKGTHRKK